MNMKLYQENIVYSSGIVVVKEERFPFSEFPLHYHGDYELILIIKGSGKKFVGDNISTFNAGELCFFGPNLPHTYYNRHLDDDTDLHQVVIQFRDEFLGMGFFDRHPFRQIREFFNRSVRGINFTGESRTKVAERIIAMLELDEAGVIIELLNILNILSKSTDFQYISSSGFNNKIKQKETNRMSEIYDYIVRHFREDIKLEEVASVACLSPEAFCRYFKKYTRKTFFELLGEMRIGYACRLLQANKQSVSQVCTQSGFNNISYFNRKFKRMMGKTPVEYQRAFAGKSVFA